jgi:aspartate aminotransferase
VAPDLKNRVVVLNGASKSYAMTGWRLGWALGPKEVINAMSNYQSQSVSCANATSQYAALEAIRNSDKNVTTTVATLMDRRDFLVGELNKIDKVKVAIPEGAFYLWVDVSAYMGKKHKGAVMHGSGELAAAFLDDQLVAVVPGVEFGLEGYFRLSYALGKEQGKEAIERMKIFFKSLT